MSDLVKGFRNVFMAGVSTPNQRPAKSMCSLEHLGGYSNSIQMHLFNLLIVKNNIIMKTIFKESKLHGVHLHKDCCFSSGW